MTDRTKNIIVGFTAIAGLVGLAYLILGVFGKIPAWLTESYPVTIHLNDASGIATGSRVRLNGIDVGFVESVVLRKPAYEGADLRCQIDNTYDIPADSKVVAAASLLGGTSQLNIKTVRPEEGGRVGPPLPKDGTALLKGTATSLTDFADRLEGDFRAQLKNFGRVSEKIIELSDIYTKVGVQAESLMTEQNLADVEAGKVQANFRTIVARADGAIVELKKTLEQVKKFASDEMHTEVKGTIVDTRKTVNDTGKKLEVLLDRYTAVADELSESLKGINGLIADAQAGKGTAGKLLKDEALYNSLNDAAQRLSDALVEGKLLIEKWKSEGLPVKW